MKCPYRCRGQDNVVYTSLGKYRSGRCINTEGLVCNSKFNIRYKRTGNVVYTIAGKNGTKTPVNTTGCRCKRKIDIRYRDIVNES